MNLRTLAPYAAVLVAAATGLSASTSPVVSTSTTQSKGAKPSILLPVWQTFASSTGRGTKIDISTGGNIVSYLSPNTTNAQYEHIGVGNVGEGYVLCYAGLAGSAYDIGESSSGFAAPVTTAQTVKRKTLDGRAQLTQGYTFTAGSDATGTNLQVSMTVKNIGTTNLTGVVVRRQVDFDIDTGGPNGWAGFQSNHARTKGGVLAFHDPSEAPAGLESHGIMMNSTGSVSGAATTTVTAGILDTQCTPTPAPIDPTFFVYRGDYGDSLSWNMGTIAPGVSKTVTLRYQRY